MSSEYLARQDFDRARRRGFLYRVNSVLSGKSADLLPFDQVRAGLPIRGQRDLGPQAVPIDKIVGSEGRYRDFDRAFLPRQSRTKSRWVSIDRAHYEEVPLPPVLLYKVGDVYFVRDGNHRVSVARERGQDFIDAYVTEIDVGIPITPDTDMREVVAKHDYALFLEQTKIDTLRPGANIQLTLAGQYTRLLEHIAVHRWYLGEQQRKPVPYEDAVCSWYDNVYMPVVKIIRELGIMKEFPKRTEADLYLWIIEHQWYLRQAFGTDVPMQEAAEGFAKSHSERRSSKVLQVLKRLLRRR